MFKKPGGVAAAGGGWETQSAASLRVVSFQSPVGSESQDHAIERLNSEQISAELVRGDGDTRRVQLCIADVRRNFTSHLHPARGS
ncbi:MAG: hypothetical protein H7Z17_03985 [Fuerstia sp.]|nr:hypothetical protein [Fuerstiella sp.]